MSGRRQWRAAFVVDHVVQGRKVQRVEWARPMWTRDGAEAEGRAHERTVCQMLRGRVTERWVECRVVPAWERAASDTPGQLRLGDV